MKSNDPGDAHLKPQDSQVAALNALHASKPGRESKTTLIVVLVIAGVLLLLTAVVVAGAVYMIIANTPKSESIISDSAPKASNDVAPATPQTPEVTSEAVPANVSRQNAQAIVSIFHAGVAAGLTWDGESKTEKIRSVVVGKAPREGPFATVPFRMPLRTLEELEAVSAYIGMNKEGDLFYDAEGKQGKNN